MLVLDPVGNALVLDAGSSDTLVLAFAATPLGGSLFCDAHGVFVPGAIASDSFLLTAIAGFFVPGSCSTMSTAYCLESHGHH
jgi:hypothetical protein